MWNMEVSTLGGKSELQLPAYVTATATQDPSHIRKAGWTQILTDTMLGSNLLSHNGNS